MKLPRFERAVIEPGKVRDYLLSTEHTVDLRTIAHTGRAVAGRASAFGQKFEVSGILTGPSGRKAVLVTVWIVRAGEDAPRLITVYPGDEK